MDRGAWWAIAHDIAESDIRHDLATKQQILGYHLESYSICDITFNHHVTPSNTKGLLNLIFYDLIVLKIAGQVIL